MKNKMKAWRKEAEKINKIEGRKHCGRRSKGHYSFDGKHFSVLLEKMLRRAGILQNLMP